MSDREWLKLCRQQYLQETLDVGWAERFSLAFAGLEVQGTWKLKHCKAFHFAVQRGLNICEHVRPGAAKFHALPMKVIPVSLDPNRASYQMHSIQMLNPRFPVVRFLSH